MTWIWSEISVRSDIVEFGCALLHANLHACECVCVFEICMKYVQQLFVVVLYAYCHVFVNGLVVVLRVGSCVLVFVLWVCRVCCVCWCCGACRVDDGA